MSVSVTVGSRTRSAVSFSSSMKMTWIATPMNADAARPLWASPCEVCLDEDGDTARLVSNHIAGQGELVKQVRALLANG